MNAKFLLPSSTQTLSSATAQGAVVLLFKSLAALIFSRQQGLNLHFQMNDEVWLTCRTVALGFWLQKHRTPAAWHHRQLLWCLSLTSDPENTLPLSHSRLFICVQPMRSPLTRTEVINQMSRSANGVLLRLWLELALIRLAHALTCIYRFEFVSLTGSVVGGMSEGKAIDEGFWEWTDNFEENTKHVAH